MNLVQRAVYQRVTNISFAFILALSTVTGMAPFIFSERASAAGETVVTNNSLQSWGQYGPGEQKFVADADAPLGSGALQISTSATGFYSQLYRDVPAAQAVNASEFSASYDTKRLAGAVHAAPAFVLGIDKDGKPDTDDYFYAWYEPIYNNDANNDYSQWNTWNINTSSLFWYNGDKPAEARSFTQTLESVLTSLPNAKVVNYTINQGSGNDGWVTLTDKVHTPQDTYDFEPSPVSVPTETKSTNQSGEVINGGFTNKNFVRNSWVGSTEATSYNYRFEKPAGLTAYTTNTTQTSVEGQLHNDNSPEGVYGFSVQAVAADGRVSAWTPLTTFTYDKSAPVISDVVITPSSNGNVGGTVVVSATITDVSGVDLTAGKTLVRFTKGLANSTGVKTASANYSLSPVAGETNRYSATIDTKTFVENGYTGTYWLYFRLQDKLGNAVGNDDTRNIVVDNQGPAISNVRVDNPTNGNTQIRVTISDPSGVNMDPRKTHVRFFRGMNGEGTSASSANVALTAVEGQPNEYIAEIDTTTFVEPGYTGTYWLYFRAEDKLGNAIGNNKTRDIVVDNQGPVIVINEVQSTEIGNNVTISGTVEGQDGNLQITISGPDQDRTYDVEPADGQWTVTVDTTGFVEGDYTISAIAADSLMNAATSNGPRSFALTTPAPAPVVEDENENENENEEVVLGIETEEPNTAPLAGRAPQTTNFGSVLGTATPEDDSQAAESAPQGEPGVAGAAIDVLAQADTDTTDGTFLGLAWYWWVLIVGGLAALIGWIIAAARRRAGDA